MRALFHSQCACCAASAESLEPGQTVSALLLMWLIDGMTLEDLYDGVCPVHLRGLDKAVADCLTEDAAAGHGPSKLARTSPRQRSCAKCGWIAPGAMVVLFEGAGAQALPGLVVRMRCPVCSEWVEGRARDERRPPLLHLVTAPSSGDR